MENYKKIDVWKREGKDFLIEVKHSTTTPYLDFEGRNKWFIYAYLYPKHNKFGEFVSEEIYQDATEYMPLHGGCTYCKKHIDSFVNITSIQVGCDYQHYGDENYSFMSDEEEAQSVFYDANKLFEYLSTPS